MKFPLSVSSDDVIDVFIVLGGFLSNFRRRLRRVSARMIPITLIRKTRPAAAAIAILSKLPSPAVPV